MSTRSKSNKRTKSSPNSPSAITAETLIADLLAIQKSFPDVTITRDFYRSNGTYGEGQVTNIFGSFVNFRKAAGLTSNPEKERKDRETSSKDLIFKDNYIYNQDSDTYVTFLKRCGQSIILSGEQHRNMLAAYSNWDGQPATINQICRTFGMRRDWFNEYKAIHGWTHDKEPFSNEELLSRPIESMVEDALQMRRQALFRKFEEEKWRTTKQNSDKWVDFEQSVFIPIMNQIKEFSGDYKPPVVKLNTTKRKFALVIAPFDLHYGKAGWTDETGESYSRDEARELLMVHTQNLVQDISAIGRPEKIVVASASDWFHIDNQQGNTTAGTPQDTDGSRSQILIEGCELAKDHVELLRQIGSPIEWLKVNGNHDYDSAFTVMLYLQAWYRATEGVSINTSPMSRQYTKYGNSLLGFSHGDSIKSKDLHGVMSQEARDLWRVTDHHYYFTGHLHHEIQRELHGITHFQLSSLSGADRWHKKAGYITSNRALQAFVVSEDRGITAEFISSVNDTRTPLGIKIKK